MKKLLLSLAAAAALFAISCNRPCQPTEPFPEIKVLADSVQKKYVPDRRDDVFDITIAESKGTPVLKGYTTVLAAKDELLKLGREKNTSLLDSITLLPDTASLDGKPYGIVNLSVATLRTKGEYAAEMSTQALLGSPIKVLQKKGWYRVQTPDGYIAWTSPASFTPMTKEEFNSWISARKIVYLEHYGFSYESPSQKARPVSDLVSGNMLKLEGDAGAFYKVSYPDGRIAYVLKQHSKTVEDWLASVKLTEESILDKAYTLIGVPYLWGGTSSKALDCSGYAKTVYFLHGVILRRDASQQAYTGIPVDISNGYGNLRKGDLMFFGKKAEGNSKERIGHVGIYIGNNEFIHEPGMVKINSLDSTKTNYDKGNASRFVRASRVLGAIDTKGIWSIANHPFYQVQE